MLSFPRSVNEALTGLLAGLLPSAFCLLPSASASVLGVPSRVGANRVARRVTLEPINERDNHATFVGFQTMIYAAVH